VRSAPYPFTVKIQDNACPYRGTQYFPFNIYVKNCASAGPKAIFYSSDTAFCNEGGQCIDFFDISTGTPTSWNWSFPGATPDTSTQKNPIGICYYIPGTYSVKLTVSNTNGSDSVLVASLIIFGSGASLPTLTISNDTVYSSHASAYQWYCNGSPVPGATKSFYVFDCITCANINVYITDSIGCSRLGNPVICTGVKALSGTYGIVIYPNPVKDQFTIYSLHLMRSARVELYDVLGQEVYSRNYEIAQTGNELAVDVSGFAKGIYTVRLVADGNTFMGKIAKE
jgi:hypothetical protein